MAVDIICDDSLVVPVCGPVPSSSLTVVKLKLREPRVAQVRSQERPRSGMFQQVPTPHPLPPQKKPKTFLNFYQF